MSVGLVQHDTSQRQAPQQEREATGRNIAAIVRCARGNPGLTA